MRDDLKKKLVEICGKTPWGIFRKIFRIQKESLKEFLDQFLMELLLWIQLWKNTWRNLWIVFSARILEIILEENLGKSLVKSTEKFMEESSYQLGWIFGKIHQFNSFLKNSCLEKYPQEEFTFVASSMNYVLGFFHDLPQGIPKLSFNDFSSISLEFLKESPEQTLGIIRKFSERNSWSTPQMELMEISSEGTTENIPRRHFRRNFQRKCLRTTEESLYNVLQHLERWNLCEIHKKTSLDSLRNLMKSPELLWNFTNTQNALKSLIKTSETPVSCLLKPLEMRWNILNHIEHLDTP